MNLFILLSNLCLLLLWLRLWVDTREAFHFNPLLSAPLRLTDRLFDFLRPVLATGNNRLLALFCMLFLIAFRGALAFRAGAPWFLTVGTGAIVRGLPLDTWQHALLFSLTDFALFLTHLSGLALLLALLSPQPRQDRASELLFAFTLPFSALPRKALALGAILMSALMAILLQHVGRAITSEMPAELRTLPTTLDWSTAGASPVVWVRLGVLSGLGLADSLLTARGLMLALVLGGLIAAVLQRRGLQQLCSELIQALLGRLGRRTMTVGLFDLTPLLFFFGLNLAYSVVVGLLFALLEHSPWT